MFEVYCDGTMIFGPGREDLALIDPKVELELNKAGSFTFTMPPGHTYYDLPQEMVSSITVYRDGTEIFAGRPVSRSVDFYNQKTVECEGQLAFLNDTIQRPAEYHDMTVRGYLETLVAAHNEQVDEDKQFTVGIVTVTDTNDSLYRYTNYNSTMTEIKEDLVDDLGGYLKVRNEDGVRYLDYLALDDYGDTSSQVIEFGKNLLDFSRNMDMTDIATAIIPLGAKLEESEIEALEMRLTIEDVNDGADYIQDDEAVENYGFIVKTVTWDGVTTASALLSKGESYLSDYQFENMIIDASAVDLHYTDEDVMQFKLGDSVRIKSSPHGMDRYFTISAMTINLTAPSKDKITFGVDNEISLTARTSEISSNVTAIDKAFNVSSLLASAVSQATALITAATHGYVMVNDVDGDGYPDELVIMDTDDTETASKVWRWNLNGLGYSDEGYNGEYGTAITMDGQIIGSYIAAGTIYAEQLAAGYKSSVTQEIAEAVGTAEETAETSDSELRAEYQSLITALETTLNDFTDTVGQYMTFTTAGLNISATTETGTAASEVQITNAGLFLLYLSEIVATIATNESTGTTFLSIANALIENMLVIGDFAFVPAADGSVGIVWQGEDDE